MSQVHLKGVFKVTRAAWTHMVRLCFVNDCRSNRPHMMLARRIPRYPGTAVTQGSLKRKGRKCMLMCFLGPCQSRAHSVLDMHVQEKNGYGRIVNVSSPVGLYGNYGARPTEVSSNTLLHFSVGYSPHDSSTTGMLKG